jgi:hypothetical protein
MFALSSLVSLPDAEFDMLGEDELALLTQRFERMHENRVNSRRNSMVCFKYDKTRHFFVECPKVNNYDEHKSKDKRRKSKKKDHGHRKKKTRSQEKMKRSSDNESDSEDTSSSSSDEKEECNKKKKKKKKNLDKYLNGLCVMGLSSKDDFYGMARSSSSTISQKDASDSDSEDEVCDELYSLNKENEEFVDLLDNRNHMLREAKKLRKKHKVLLEDAKTRVAELETQVLDGKLEMDSLKASPMVCDEVDCVDCSMPQLILLLLGKNMLPCVRN